jgi:hypothetical protein
MSGHSLGAGVAGLLALVSTAGFLCYSANGPSQMWADPTTCLTVGASGLPVGRRVSVYCIAPPYVRQEYTFHQESITNISPWIIGALLLGSYHVSPHL